MDVVVVVRFRDSSVALSTRACARREKGVVYQRIERKVVDKRREKYEDMPCGD